MILLNGEPVASQLRDADVTRAASMVAVVPGVREWLVTMQRRIAQQHGRIVTEGRDQGSVVFPEADRKFYLDATPQERCRRRVEQLRARGEVVNSGDILRDIMERDRRDAARAVGPLVVPRGAVVIDSTELTQAQVVALIVQAAREKA